MEETSEKEFSFDDRYSMNNSMVGVFKERNNITNNKSTSGNLISKIEDALNSNEEDEEELSDIEHSSDNNDFEEDFEVLSRFNRDNYLNYTDDGIEKEEDFLEYEEEDIIPREVDYDEICEYCRSIYEKENDLYFNIEEGFTQMVDKKIRKLYNKPDYVNNKMLEILMIAEKPSLAKIITKILGGREFQTHHCDPLTIYTFERLFKGKKAFFTVSSIRGHIYQDAFEKDKNEDLDVNELYQEKIVKILKRNKDENENKKMKLNIARFLRNIAKGKDILCLWLDCDQEGENICYEVIHNVYPYMNRRNYQQIYRAKFNALTPTDIRESFYNLNDYPNKNISMGVDARSIIDFKVGVCFTRLFSTKILRYIKKYNKEGFVKRIMSYGPCQTPTLWFCVQRFKERKYFKPKSYYQIIIEI